MADSAKYRHALPQGSGALFLTDGGIETTLIFQDGFDLPHFAAFPLLRDPKGREALVRYYERYIAIAKADRMGFVLESPTWRASTDWGSKLGYAAADIVAANQDSLQLMHDLRAAPRDDDVAHGGERLHRPARRRLRSRPGHVGTGGRGLSPPADRRLRRCPRRHGERHHHDQRQRGDRHCARGGEGRPARGRRLHRGDRRQVADRAEPGRRDLRGRRRDGQGASLLHDQLRPSHALRQDTGQRAVDSGASAGCAPTPPSAATRS